MPEIKRDDLHEKAKCKTISHNHKYFDCDYCRKEFEIRDDSKLNICYDCLLFMCDKCFERHCIEINNYFKCDNSECNKIFDCVNDLYIVGEGISSSELCEKCYKKEMQAK